MMILGKVKCWLASLAAVALVGCGGGGSAGNAVLGGGGSTPEAASVQIKFSAASVDNSGTQDVTATITALDANGQGVKGVPLAIKVDNNATYTITSSGGSTTGTDGTVTAKVTIGSDTSIRTITLTAAAGSISKSASFDVTGSKLAATDLIVTAAPSIANTVTNTVTVTVTAVDANRNALANIPVTLSVDNGATITPSGTVTTSGGTLTGVLRIGQDQSNRGIKVKATSGSISRETTVQVTGAKLTASSFSTTVGVATANSITYLLVDNTGAKMAGYPIVVKATGLPDVNGTTNSDGEYIYRYTAPSTAQTLVIQALAGGVPHDETVAVTGSVVVPPAQIAVTSASVAASPNVVAVNSPGATSLNKVEVRALFVGNGNAPVQNVRVWFDLGGDPQSIGGFLDSKAAGKLLYSDANGVARTTYAPGARFSPKDGVTIRACWSPVDFAIPAEGGACPNAVTNTLTVASESLSVSIGTNAQIGVGASGGTYTQQFVVQVVDAAGVAKSGVQVSPSIDLLRYFKGYWIPGSARWIQGGMGTNYPALYPSGAAVSVAALAGKVSTATVGWSQGNVTECDNEDLNRNGVSELFVDAFEGVSVSEDQNGSATMTPQRAALDPRKADVTISVVGSSATDANGVVVLKIEYPQNIASWVEYNILVAASGVAGTEGRTNFKGVLGVPATVVNILTAEPPFRLSPYGYKEGSDAYQRRNPQGQSGWLCTNPN